MDYVAPMLLAAGYVLVMFANPVRACMLDGWRCVRRYPVLWRLLGLLGFAHALFHLSVRLVLHFQFVPELTWGRAGWHDPSMWWSGTPDSLWWLPPSAIRQALRDAALPALESLAGIFNNAITTFPLAVIAAAGLFVNRRRSATLLRRALRKRFGAWAWLLLAAVYLGAIAVITKAALYFLLPVLANPVWFQWAPLVAWVAAIFEYLFGVGIQIYLILHAFAWVRGLSFEPDALREVAIRRLGAAAKWAGVVILASSLVIELPLVLKNIPSLSALFPDSREAVEFRNVVARFGLSIVLLCFASMQASLILHGETLRRAWSAHWRFLRVHGWEFFWLLAVAGIHLFTVQALRGAVLRGLGENTASGLAWTLVWPWLAGLVTGWCLASWICLFKRCESALQK
ncbi:MAG: hypothetical protein ABMA01_09610 [Chthoniobacteraceae bacterium]